MIDRYSAISPFSGYNFETIQSVSKHIWGEGKLYDYDIANQIEQLIAPFPMEYIDGLRDIPEGNKQKIQIMNSISQLLTHIRNRQIVDESIRLFKDQNIVIPVFGKTHGHSCFHAFEYVMQNI